MPNSKLKLGIISALLVIIFVAGARVAYNSYYDDESGPGGPSQDSQMANETPETIPSTSGRPFKAPMPDYASRITKKTFGTYVEPGNSPVSPEKFTGFHSAIDLETFENEQNTEIPFIAICDGELAMKRMAQGYGGVVAQYCDLNGQRVTVVYGHVALSSIRFNVGDPISQGQRIGLLGEVGPDTDNERKHLHLGILKPGTSGIMGYVQSESSLSGYVDPRTVLEQ